MFLVGYRGSGKSTVGQELAARLKWEFCDMDRLVEEATGKTIANVFREEGEQAFRARESEVLGRVARRLATGVRMVVATGGGVVLAPANVDVLRRSGLVVWLVASPAVLRRRIERDPNSSASRPALEGRSSADEVESVLERREPLYRAAAHLEVPVDDLSTAGVVDMILERARARSTQA